MKSIYLLSNKLQDLTMKDVMRAVKEFAESMKMQTGPTQHDEAKVFYNKTQQTPPEPIRCRDFTANGYCRRGDSCRYYHGVKNGHVPVSPAPASGPPQQATNNSKPVRNCDHLLEILLSMFQGLTRYGSLVHVPPWSCTTFSLATSQVGHGLAIGRSLSLQDLFLPVVVGHHPY